MPRASSTVSENPQVFVPDRSFQPSFSHVSWPTSPGRGTVWNSHSFLPVTASNARVSPGGPTGSFEDGRADHDDVLVDRRRPSVADHHVDFAVGPEAFRWLSGRRVERQEARARSHDDSLGRGAVAGEIADAAARHSPARTSAGDLALPNHFPRVCLERDDGVAGGEIHHAADDNRHGFEDPPRAGAPPRPGAAGKSYFHACTRFATLPVVISVNGENRVPARSWLNVCHSWAGVACFCCALGGDCEHDDDERHDEVLHREPNLVIE